MHAHVLRAQKAEQEEDEDDEDDEEDDEDFDEQERLLDAQEFSDLDVDDESDDEDESEDDKDEEDQVNLHGPLHRTFGLTKSFHFQSAGFSPGTPLVAELVVSLLLPRS